MTDILQQIPTIQQLRQSIKKTKSTLRQQKTKLKSEIKKYLFLRNILNYKGRQLEKELRIFFNELGFKKVNHIGKKDTSDIHIFQDNEVISIEVKSTKNGQASRTEAMDTSRHKENAKLKYPHLTVSGQLTYEYINQKLHSVGLVEF